MPIMGKGGRHYEICPKHGSYEGDECPDCIVEELRRED